MTDLWGPIDSRFWQQTPCLRGRIATEDDVMAGRAVFFLHNGADIGAEAIDLDLPARALLTDEKGIRTEVVVVQAEEAKGRELAGFRFLQGGNGVATLAELTFLPNGDA